MLTLQDFQFLNELEQTNPEVYNSILDMQKRNNIDISNCCHDLLNIVTLINGHLQLLELFNPQLQNDRHLITITENINYLTDALTSISKYRHARDLKKSTTDICRLVESVIANHDEADIHLSCADNLPTVIIDKEKIAVNINNMIENVLELDSSGRININIFVRNSLLHIQVCDNLIGLTPDVHNLIFKPFTTDKANHIGLSLSTAYQTMIAHGGNLTYSENNPTGSIFTMQFPLP